MRALNRQGQNESTALSNLRRIVTQVTAKVVLGGVTPGFFMSGHLRFCLAAFVLPASLSTSPASSNPFADLFNVAPQPAAALASAERECLPRPGKSTADGQHWVYRLDGHRKCWFQVAEGIATVKKRVHHQAAKHRIVDARAESLRSAPAETSQLTPPASELKVVDAASVVATGAAALAPSAPDVETLQAAAPAASDAVAASVATDQPPVAFPIAEAGDDGRGWTANWLGMLLMALGLVSVLSSSRVLRGAVLLQLK